MRSARNASVRPQPGAPPGASEATLRRRRAAQTNEVNIVETSGNVNPAPVVVRLATEEDGKAVLAMYAWLFEPPGARPAQWRDEDALTNLQHVISSASSAVLMACGPELVGGCTVYLDIRSVRFGQRAWVEDLAVHPRQRSRGIGRLLLAGAKEWARDRGASHLELESADARADAHRFYEREQPSWRSVCFGWQLR